MDIVSERWALRGVDGGRFDRDERGELVTVDCDLHGRNVPHPRHADIHHVERSCPTVPHCAFCWHGWPLLVACDCPTVLDAAELIDLTFEKAS